MSVNIRYPNITGLTEKEQLAQIKSYLHQLVEHLNYALPTLGSGDTSGQTAPAQTYEMQGGQISYYELRSLIIQELQEVETRFDQLAQNLDNNVDESVETALGKLSFTMDEDGNLYYELEE